MEILQHNQIQGTIIRRLGIQGDIKHWLRDMGAYEDH